VKPDKESLEVWYRMLIDVRPEDFEKAVMQLCKNHKELAFINFVAETLDIAGQLQEIRKSESQRHAFSEKMREWEDTPAAVEQRTFLTDFIKKMADK